MKKMGIKVNSALICLFLAVFGILPPPSSFASSLAGPPPSTEELAQKADLLVIGRATSKEAEWDEQHNTINTYYRIEVEQIIKGKVVPDLVVRYEGGEAEGMGTWRSDVNPDILKIGDQVILFLQPDNQYPYSVTGGENQYISIKNHRVDFGKISELDRWVGQREEQTVEQFVQNIRERLELPSPIYITPAPSKERPQPTPKEPPQSAQTSGTAPAEKKEELPQSAQTSGTAPAEKRAQPPSPAQRMLIPKQDKSDHLIPDSHKKLAPSPQISISSGLPNLKAYVPSGWGSALVVSSVSGTSYDGPNLNNCNNTYIDWAVINNF
ncbi:MAG: hypothetical protein HZA78_09705 [Candidatus Schekmanbacteria bacterium]|nr:hypothetical protein [Candidatus Schekmanbacteria bacterium]